MYNSTNSGQQTDVRRIYLPVSLAKPDSNNRLQYSVSVRFS